MILKKMKQKIEKRKLRIEENKAMEEFKKEEFNHVNLKNNLIKMRMRVLVKYIDFHFSLEGQDDLIVFRSKLRVVRSLDKDVLLSAIARTKGMEKIYETKYTTFFVGAILAATVPVIAAFGDLIPAYTIIIRVYIMIFTMLTLIFFLKDLIKDKYFVALLVSFREMMEQALAEKHEK
ncbi:hypothetical protein ABE33_10380 [Bacillus safensis]|uniref:hypothetical protein n=1 Tax=Bacillus TaxID=1386 RepID=UPI0018CDA9CD|nr:MULTISPECIES: hypothetical protein [Bacillus]MBG9826043.1 hypothetical protein [Bacillus safensis]MBG9835688.1 hypothetical protein [Bacillus safensis]MBG9861429.1 hypothetical protein [Bacillus safensis]MBG9900628.1 hypothetical protein [Bacillus safensis]MCP9283660.1 hypothetical protein [Bacillus safensis]